MGLNSYQETVLHNRDAHMWGESSVFRVDYPDGSQLCLKEYYPQLNYLDLKYYHQLHTYFSKHPFEYSTNFVFNDQHITTIKFEVLDLGLNIFPASSIRHEKQICISTVPYVGGIHFHDAVLHSEAALRELCEARDTFVEKLSKVGPLYIDSNDLDDQLCACNMKCNIDGNVMTVTVTDLCGGINTLYNLCSRATFELLETLHTTPQHVTQ